MRRRFAVNEAVRNFTVRFEESALRRVETTAKPFYGGRLSTGEAIRRLAEERLEEIENEESVEQSRDALLRILNDWRTSRPLPIADLRFIADSAHAAYQRCRKDFVSKDLFTANVSAFREALKLAARAKGVEAHSPDGRCYWAALSSSAGPDDAQSLVNSADESITGLPPVLSPPQAEVASRNLPALLRDADCPDAAQLDRTLRPYLSALLQLAVRAHWHQERRPLLGEGHQAQPSRPTYLSPIRQGNITLKPLVRDHELALLLHLPGGEAIATANNLVEVEDLTGVTRLALEGHEVRGEVFHWSRQPDAPRQFVLSTERGSWMLDAADASCLGQALAELFRVPSISALAERGRFIYGRI